MQNFACMLYFVKNGLKKMKKIKIGCLYNQEGSIYDNSIKLRFSFFMKNVSKRKSEKKFLIWDS